MLGGFAQKEVMDIIKELAKISPVFEDSHGWVGCFFCGVEEIICLQPLRLEQHDDNCVWKAAQQSVQLTDGGLAKIEVESVADGGN